jgi:hypothetical protein
MMEKCKKRPLPKISKVQKPPNIYNADKTELCFKLLPNTALGLKQNPSSGGKNSTNTIFLLLSCNIHLKNVQMIPTKYDDTFYYLMDVKDVFYPRLHQHFATT